jgi:hypothetical protein
MPKEVDTTKVREAVALARQVAGLRRELKRREKKMSLEEYVKYVDETRPRPESEEPKRV